MVKKKPANKSRKLTAEQEYLLRQEKELRQKEVLLKRRLQQLPAAMEKKRRHQQKEHRYAKVIHTTLAGTSRLPGAFSPGIASRRSNRGLPMRERRAAKIKFIVLVMILASMLILIWRSLPA